MSDREKSSKTSRLEVEYLKEQLRPDEERIVEYNGLTLTIPEGAVDTELQIKVFNQFEQIPPSRDEVELIGFVYRLEPHDTVFHKEYTISIAYFDEHVKEKHLKEGKDNLVKSEERLQIEKEELSEEKDDNKDSEGSQDGEEEK